MPLIPSGALISHLSVDTRFRGPEYPPKAERGIGASIAFPTVSVTWSGVVS